eukprot:CAMPEP_0171111150 /NCGR_PEP_ID=MMETSP0766_2-20121228/74049_1 /TAXON_ID=439317 /ORGANISM="Gambierdiscus australes, Strain CAWD 149" /LENGTH=274 /DNA_ID=CAMNT_0011573109 /DNA_START=24 /DNA_END=845 /DNA_ORIENTATION=+
MSKFGDHAGVRSREEIQRHAKPGLRLKSTVDSVLYGRDIDGSGDANAHEEQMKALNEGAAGVRSGDKARGRKTAMQMQTCVDEVVFSKEHAPSSESEDFVATFREYAGVRSGQSIIRTNSCPAGQLTARSNPPEAPGQVTSTVAESAGSAQEDQRLADDDATLWRSEGMHKLPAGQRKALRTPELDSSLVSENELTKHQLQADAEDKPAEELAPAPAPLPTAAGLSPQRVNPFEPDAAHPPRPPAVRRLARWRPEARSEEGYALTMARLQAASA